MQSLRPLAEKIAARLIERRETIAIAESSTGGLIAAALIAVPGASAYFAGGAVVYTKVARSALLGIGDAEMAGLQRRARRCLDSVDLHLSRSKGDDAGHHFCKC